MLEGRYLEQAVRVAGRLVGSYPLADGYQRRVIEQTAPSMLGKAVELVEEETGLSGVTEPTVTVIDRLRWVERNLASFSVLLGPAEEKVERGLVEAGIGDRLSKRIVALEFGVLLGLLSHRVLGQYDLMLVSPNGGDEVSLPAPNILELERKLQFRPAEFRFWVILHEATHLLQFVGVPWLRSYFLDLASSLVSLSEPDESRLAVFLSAIRESGAKGLLTLDEAGIPGLMATPAELERLDKVQALMSLLEGHGHVVMDRIASRCLVGWRRMSAMVTRRRNNPRVAALLRLTGLEMKLRQYEEGRDFVLRVEERAGWPAVNLAWQSPETLPGRSEIRDPESWLARVG